RIHRSNLVGMGVLPLQFLPEENAQSLGLTGEETYEINGVADLASNFTPGKRLTVCSTANGTTCQFSTLLRIDTPQELQYYANGGILQYVLRQLLAGKPKAQEVSV
ncbi:MAG: aconitate hydratase, partial [Acidobacteriales bacterium]|nr:aconitate hydratase [Terriglobales bacterium]